MGCQEKHYTREHELTYGLTTKTGKNKEQQCVLMQTMRQDANISLIIQRIFKSSLITKMIHMLKRYWLLYKHHIVLFTARFESSAAVEQQRGTIWKSRRCDGRAHQSYSCLLVNSSSKILRSKLRHSVEPFWKWYGTNSVEILGLSSWYHRNVARRVIRISAQYQWQRSKKRLFMEMCELREGLRLRM